MLRLEFHPSRQQDTKGLLPKPSSRGTETFLIATATIKWTFASQLLRILGLDIVIRQDSKPVLGVTWSAAGLIRPCLAASLIIQFDIGV